MEIYEISVLNNVRAKRFRHMSIGKEQLVKMFRTPKESTDKNTNAFILAQIDPNYINNTTFTRESKSPYITGFNTIIYDLDYVNIRREVEKLEEHGLEYLYYSTFNHKQTDTTVKSAKLLSLTLNEDILDYAKQYHPHLELDSTKPYTKHSDHVVFHHEPVNKYRLIIFLDQYFTDLKNWKLFIRKVAQDYNITMDLSCTDTSRIYFLPTVNKDNKDSFEFRYREGRELSVSKYIQLSTGTFYAKQPEQRSISFGGIDDIDLNKIDLGRATKKISQQVIYTDSSHKSINLTTFAHANNSVFLINEFMELYMQEAILQTRENGGHYITCPNIDNHSFTNVTDTYCDDEDTHFTIHCSHNCCSHKTTLDLLKELLQQYDVPVSAFSIIADTSDFAAEFSHFREENLTAEIDSSLLKFINVLRDNEQNVERFENMLIENDVSSREAVELIALSAFTEPRIYSLVPYFKETYNIPQEELFEDIRTYRGVKNGAIQEVISSMVSKSISNLDIDDRLYHMSAYYLVDLETLKISYEKQYLSSFPRNLRNRIKLYDKLIAVNIGAGQNKFVILDKEITDRPDLETFLENYPAFKSKSTFPEFASAEGLKLPVGNIEEIIVEGGKTRKVDSFKFWLKHTTRKKIFGKITFNPNINEPFIKEGTSSYATSSYNLWKGFLTPILPKRYDQKWRHIRDHLYYGACRGNDDSFNWLMTWFASIVQRPTQKPPAAVIFSGGYGTGKSIIADQYLGRLLYPYHYYTKDIKSVLKPKDGDLSYCGKLCINIDEGVFSGDQKTMRELLSFIQSDTVTVRPLFVNRFEMPNFARIILTTNETARAVTLQQNDRRYSIFQTSEAWEEKYRQNEKYFKPLIEGLYDPEVLGAFYAVLKYWEPSECNLKWDSLQQPVKNEERIKQLTISYPDEAKLIYQLIKNGMLETYSEDAPNIYWRMGEVLNMKDIERVLIDQLRHNLGYRYKYVDENHDMFARELFKAYKGEKCAWTSFPLATRKELLDYLAKNGLMSREDYDYSHNVGDSKIAYYKDTGSQQSFSDSATLINIFGNK